MYKKILSYSLFVLFITTNSYGLSFNDDKKTIKVFFADAFKDENSSVQSFDDWYKGNKDRVFTLKKLYKDGWILNNVIKTNVNARDWQMTFFMEIDESKYKSIKEKYEKKEIKKNKNVTPSEGL